MGAYIDHNSRLFHPIHTLGCSESFSNTSRPYSLLLLIVIKDQVMFESRYGIFFVCPVLDSVCQCSPLGLSVIIIAFDCGIGFGETNVIKSGKTGAVYVLSNRESHRLVSSVTKMKTIKMRQYFDGVVGNEKVFFPSHKHEVCVPELIVVEVITIECL